MHYKIYCDESRQVVDRYMALGGIIIDSSEVQDFEEKMNEFRQLTKMHSELKWKKVTNQKYLEYKTFIDYFFELNHAGIVNFHCILLDTHLFDHKRYNNGNKEIGFYKFYYQLLLHCFGKNYCRGIEQDNLFVRLDYRQSNYSLDELKNILNVGIKRYNILHDPFKSIEPRDSSQSNLLQITDLLLGAVGFQKNGYHLKLGSREAKINLATYIAKQAGIPDLISDTKWSKKDFTIWNFKLSSNKKSALLA